MTNHHLTFFHLAPSGARQPPLPASPPPPLPYHRVRDTRALPYVVHTKLHTRTLRRARAHAVRSCRRCWSVTQAIGSIRAGNSAPRGTHATRRLACVGSRRVLQVYYEKSQPHTLNFKPRTHVRRCTPVDINDVPRGDLALFMELICNVDTHEVET